MEGKRITIYLPAGVHEEMKEEAWYRRLSLSGYLVELHKSALSKVQEPPLKQPAEVTHPVSTDLPKSKTTVTVSDTYFKPMPKKGGN